MALLGCSGPVNPAPEKVPGSDSDSGSGSSRLAGAVSGDARGTRASPETDLAAWVARVKPLGAYPLLLELERILGGLRVGSDASPGEEPIRFRHDPALAFRAAEVTEVRERELPAGETAGARRVLEITTAFLGLTGAASPLPPYFAEEVAQEDPEAPLRRGFLDLFHHRLLSLFYRARLRSDFPNSYRSDHADAWSVRVLSLLGVDAPAALAVPAWRILRWAPLLAERAVTAAAIEAAVEDVLSADLDGAHVAVEPFVGSWAAIHPEELNRLGRASSRLGRDLVLGRRVFDRAGKFRIVVGPLSRAGFDRFAREEAPRRRIAETVRALCGDPLELEIVLWLSKDAAPHMALGHARLGRDTWLGGQVRESRVRVEVPA